MIDHWSVAVLTVTVHPSFFPTFDFFKKSVAFCTGFNLLTPIFSLPYIIMDLLILLNVRFCQLLSISFHPKEVLRNLKIPKFA